MRSPSCRRNTALNSSPKKSAWLYNEFDCSAHLPVNLYIYKFWREYDRDLVLFQEILCQHQRFHSLIDSTSSG